MKLDHHPDSSGGKTESKHRRNKSREESDLDIKRKYVIFFLVEFCLNSESVHFGLKAFQCAAGIPAF